ncbi:alpha/beta hydrolase [Solirubrobacter sp. CPCC 204708]|uniref:Alpha/beta hydrolase n=1 Tax=Solirubrobacter deserti TaxID=2282478 RepID=A0ABT4RLJ2_9ACTN|nr:alpha/beta hydrolase [Solirubrobacter deserti]MBE2320427.1 alpha/beta hydrolase [Solirubrobacter deserti]MDA0139382.1 alpha/beta hydrolase [Solirubrobacter deserti]
MNASETGYIPVGDLNVYYETYGEGGFPLLLLHGGLFDIEQQWAALIPGLAADRRVIAIDFQAHGRTNDIDRPLAIPALADDVVEVLKHLGLEQVDVFGFSVGGAVTIELAVHHPQLVRRIVVSSTSFSPDGDRGGNTEVVMEMTVDMIAGTPMEQVYMAKSPHPDREHLQTLLDKLGGIMEHTPGWTEDEIRAITAPTLITIGDCDMVKIEHAAHFLRLRGGDVNGDFEGVPESQLAVFPGSTHFSGIARTDLVLPAVRTFLD